MVQVISLLVVLVLSMMIARIATVALVLTGMSRASARFQTRSALTGAGYTTNEAEGVVNHPLRRRIVMWLMLIGNSGLVIVAALLINLVGGANANDSSTLWKMLLLLAGLLALYFLAQSRWLDRRLSHWIERALRRYTEIDVRDYAGLLRLRGDYHIVELIVEEGDWLAQRSLIQLNLSQEGVLVLGIVRPGDRFIGAPRGQTMVYVNDTLLLYGREQAIRELDERRADSTGNFRHVQAIAKVKAEQQQEQSEASDLAQPELGTPSDVPPTDEPGRF